MDISSTPLHRISMFPEEERDHNHLSDFELFLGHTQPFVPENSSTNAESSGKECRFLSVSLPPRNKSIEPRSGDQERM